MVQRVLTDAAKNGLPGDHHFYVSFDTRAPGVRISQRLREEHPEEMTIVLQHQFWDLTVTDDEFEVGLSFKGIPERLGVPFAAIKGFFDPSVQFALQFDVGGKEGAEAPAEPAPPAVDDQPSGKARGARSKGAKTSGAVAPTRGAQPSAVAPAPAAASDESGDKPDRPAGGAEVVRLDRFRKK
jgi:hypothetical protein